MSIVKECAKLLIKNNLKIATAESCTGGMVASKLVDYPGVSECFEQGFITYSNYAKESLLGVKESTLKEYGAVSAETARQMAHFVRKKANADIGIATTGIAGPGGGTDQKPVGLVYIACAIEGRIVTRCYYFKGNRAAIRKQSTNRAFRLLNDCLNGYGKNI